jgi:predicted dehydrogenase
MTGPFSPPLPSHNQITMSESTSAHPPTTPPGPDPGRREFLTRSAALAGAGVLLGSGVALGKDDPTRKIEKRTATRAPVEDGKPLKIGVIGTGGMGSGHLHGFLSHRKDGAENVDVVALCDVCKPRVDSNRAAMAEKQGIEVEAYRYHEDLLAREDLHGVLIATPEHWHAQMVIDAVMAGKDVYIEKPMTLRLDEALVLRELMSVNEDAIVQVGTQYMMRPKYKVIRDLIADGRIGKPTFSQTGYCRNSKGGEWLYHMDPAWVPGDALDWERWCGPLGLQPWDPAVYARWRRYRKFSTGIIGDLLVHMTTPLLYALGAPWPVRVTAAGGHYLDQEMENHDQVNITMELEGGHTTSIVGSTCNEQGLEELIRGHEANLYFGGKDVVLRPERVFSDDIDGETISCDTLREQDFLRLDWMKSIRTREPNQSPVEMACKVMVMVDLATRSMWDGHAYAFDPKTLRTRAI